MIIHINSKKYWKLAKDRHLLLIGINKKEILSTINLITQYVKDNKIELFKGTDVYLIKNNINENRTMIFILEKDILTLSLAMNIELLNLMNRFPKLHVLAYTTRNKKIDLSSIFKIIKL